MIGELAAGGEQEVGRDEAGGAGKPAAAAGHLEHGRAVPQSRVRTRPEYATGPERDRVAVAEADLAGLDERAVPLQLEIAPAQGLVGTRLSPEAAAAELDRLAGELESEGDAIHAADGRDGRLRAVPWNYGTCSTARIPSAASTPASCVRFETASLR